MVQKSLLVRMQDAIANVLTRNTNLDLEEMMFELRYDNPDVIELELAWGTVTVEDLLDGGIIGIDNPLYQTVVMGSSYKLGRNAITHKGIYFPECFSGERDDITSYNVIAKQQDQLAEHIQQIARDQIELWFHIDRKKMPKSFQYTLGFYDHLPGEKLGVQRAYQLTKGISEIYKKEAKKLKSNAA